MKETGLLKIVDQTDRWQKAKLKVCLCICKTISTSNTPPGFKASVCPCLHMHSVLSFTQEENWSDYFLIAEVQCCFVRVPLFLRASRFYVMQPLFQILSLTASLALQKSNFPGWREYLLFSNEPCSVMIQWKNQSLEFDGPVYISVLLPSPHECVQMTKLLGKVDSEKGLKDSGCCLNDKCNTGEPLLISLARKTTFYSS